MLDQIDNLLVDSSELARQSLYGAIVDGWLSGATAAIDGLPETVIAPLASPIGPPGVPPTPPVTTADFFGGEGEPPGIDLVAIDHAIQALQSRAVVLPEEFYSLDAAARQQSFTVTADLATESIAKLRDALAADVAEGPSLTSFRDRVLGEFDTLPLAEHHLENVYRSNVNEAFSQGMDRVLDHPLVEDAFPYRRYVPIHDARCRPEHLEFVIGHLKTSHSWAELASQCHLR